MKKSLEHLPKNKQKELSQIKETLLEMVPSAQMIILYGSFARGDWVEDRTGEDGVIYEYLSDFDILVITEDKASARSDKLWHQVEDKLFDCRNRTPVSVIAHYMSEVNRKIEEGYYFFGDIKKEGIMLFDTGRFQLSSPKQQDPVKLQAAAQSDYDHWFEKSEDFFVAFGDAKNTSISISTSCRCTTKTSYRPRRPLVLAQAICDSVDDFSSI